MVGNDVIDLGDPEARPGGCHARFDARVFAAVELEQLAASTAPVRLRWILWAAKEAAFKVAKKDDARTIFSPRRFVVCVTSGTQARVAHDARRFAVELEIGARYVHAIATDGGNPGARVVAGVERIAWGGSTCPGSAARTLAIRALAPLLGIAAAELSVAREARVPRLCRGSVDVATDLSLSHHGRFVAFACTLPEVGAQLQGLP